MTVQSIKLQIYPDDTVTFSTETLNSVNYSFLVMHNTKMFASLP